jgi:hypothetical protein
VGASSASESVAEVAALDGNDSVAKSDSCRPLLATWAEASRQSMAATFCSRPSSRLMISIDPIDMLVAQRSIDVIRDA